MTLVNDDYRHVYLLKIYGDKESQKRDLYPERPPYTIQEALVVLRSGIMTQLLLCHKYISRPSVVQALAYLGGAIGFGTSCRVLQSISLADCKQVSDYALKVLVEGCPRIRFLNLSGCEKVRLV